MTTDTLRPELPTVPKRMRGLKLDRGYPVPWFVPWLNDDDPPKEVADGEGRPEFRMMSEHKFVRAIKQHRCWLCGGELGKYRAFVIGPMCLVNKINAEPPSHLECAEFGVTGCPFLTRPHMTRRAHEELKEMGTEMAGIGIERNPGVTCLYVVDTPFTLQGDGKGGVLIGLPEPHEVRFYAEGRQATVEEIERSVETGLPRLIEVCENDEERQEVMDRAAQALAKYIPAASPRE